MHGGPRGNCNILMTFNTKHSTCVGKFLLLLAVPTVPWISHLWDLNFSVLRYCMIKYKSCLDGFV